MNTAQNTAEIMDEEEMKILEEIQVQNLKLAKCRADKLARIEAERTDYVNKKFSPQQIQAINSCFESYTQGSTISDVNARYAVLMAQMQSGKTDVFLAVGALLFTNNLCENIVIFSGNAEIAMKNQHQDLIEREKFCNKMVALLEDFGYSTETQLKTREFLMTKIKVIWGGDLDKGSSIVPKKDTFYVWDESHFAQSKGNRTEKFLRSINVAVNGDTAGLVENNNYFMSVSATPTSEYIDNFKLNQKKIIVYMEPGEGYIGVRNLLDSGLIENFDDYKDCLKLAINECPNNKYIIIRASEKHSDTIRQICEVNGANCMTYNQTTTERTNINRDIIDIIPNRKTVVIIKGLLTMGQRLNKPNVSAVIETRETSNTDTIVQGLLGRICGYYRNQIKVYLHRDISFDELEKFIFMHTDGVISCPSKGMNVKFSKRKFSSGSIFQKLTHIIPMGLPAFTAGRDKDLVRADIIAALNDETMLNNNNREVTDAFAQLIERDDVKIVFRNGNIFTYRDEYDIVTEFMVSKRPFHSNKAGCGIGKDGKQVNIWYKPSGKIIIVCSLILEDICKDGETEEEYCKRIQIDSLPQTTGRELFCCPTETGNIISNGAFSMHLKPETATDIDMMLESICECVSRSLDTDSCLTPPPRKLASNYNSTGWQGIIVNNEVLYSLKFNGKIYMEVKRRFSSVIIKIKKVAGPKSSKFLGYNRLSEISW